MVILYQLMISLVMFTLAELTIKASMQRRLSPCRWYTTAIQGCFEARCSKGAIVARVECCWCWGWGWGWGGVSSRITKACKDIPPKNGSLQESLTDRPISPSEVKEMSQVIKIRWIFNRSIAQEMKATLGFVTDPFQIGLMQGQPRGPICSQATP